MLKISTEATVHAKHRAVLERHRNLVVHFRIFLDLLNLRVIHIKDMK